MTMSVTMPTGPAVHEPVFPVFPVPMDGVGDSLVQSYLFLIY
jgi:hypothetical protein